MYGQMTAGSWIYIGTQGILQGTYETFAEAARQHFNGTLRGTVTLTAGLGGMGGAQPLAVTMNEGVCLAIEVDEARARRRLEIGYVDLLTHDPAEALLWARAAARDGDATSIALVGNAAEIEPAWAAAGERFDLVTDQTSAHDALAGYVPDEMTLADALTLRSTQPAEYERRSRAAMAAHVRAMLAFQRAGAIVFDYGNSISGPATALQRRDKANNMAASTLVAAVRNAGPRHPGDSRSAGRARGQRRTHIKPLGSRCAPGASSTRVLAPSRSPRSGREVWAEQPKEKANGATGGRMRGTRWTRPSSTRASRAR